MSGPIFLKSCPPKVSDKRKWVVITASWVYLLYNVVRNACRGRDSPNTTVPDLVRLGRGLADSVGVRGFLVPALGTTWYGGHAGAILQTYLD